jgi:prolyl-tRNA synthetase
MSVTQISPKYRHDPNEKIHSIYHGVAPGGKVVTRTIRVNHDQTGLEATREYEPGVLARGEGGNVGTIILGGMETTLDEMHDILEEQKEKKWVPRRSTGEIADMCRQLMENRNDTIRYYQKNPSEAPKPRPKPQLFLPVGCRMVDTPIPGFRILAQG